MLGWLVAIVLGILLAGKRRELKRLRAEQSRLGSEATPRGDPAPDSALGVPGAEQLVVLRLEVGRMAEAGELAETEYRHLSGQIDAQWQATLARAGIEPGAPIWRKSCTKAWYTLAARGLVPYTPRPWERAAAPGHGAAAPGAADPESVPTTPVREPEPLALAGASARPDARPPLVCTALEAGPTVLGSASVGLESARRVAVPESSTPAPAGPDGKSHGEPTRRLTSAPAPAGPDPWQPAATAPAWAGGALVLSRQHTGGEPAGPQETAAFALRPADPTALERALRALTGWPRALLPFLVQNIGWFIGGFLFLAGSVFLVSYTAGFARTLAVFAALLAYNGGLLWGGYQIRLRRPALVAASDTLLTLGMLLVPLVLSAAARLLLAGTASWLHGAIGAAATLVALAAFLFAAQVVSGVTDRALQGAHPRFYVALAAVQLALPLLARWPAWPVLMALHLLLLGLLAYGLVRYARGWMRSIFLDQRKVAYFAGGTLLYAGLVSFVHLTWGAGPLALPPGYYAPYLMAVCGLLFYLDAAFKTWAHAHAFLSRFSFLVYGLSILAVLVSLEGDIARVLTLALGALLYGAVAWRYLTRVPVYLLLASLGALYWLTVLDRVPADWHFVASLPALAGLLAVSRWTQALAARRPAALPLARLTYRVLFGLAVALAAWSLVHARPGLVAMTTGALLAALAWGLLAAAPSPLVGGTDGAAEPDNASARLDLRDGPWLYTVILAVTATVGFAPAWTGLGPAVQLAVGLLLLAWVWAELAARSPPRHLGRVEVYAGSALVSVVAGLALATVLTPDGPPGQSAFLALTCGLAAGPLLRLSLRLYVRALFYAFLGVAAAGAVHAKLAFFPGPSTGAAVLVVGLAVWSILWWLERQPAALEALRLERVPRPLTLLGLFRLADEAPPLAAPTEHPPQEAPDRVPGAAQEMARV